MLLDPSDRSPHQRVRQIAVANLGSLRSRFAGHRKFSEAQRSSLHWRLSGIVLPRKQTVVDSYLLQAGICQESGVFGRKGAPFTTVGAMAEGRLTRLHLFLYVSTGDFMSTLC